MPVACSHCGHPIDILIPPNMPPMHHYHGRCYSQLLAPLEQRDNPLSTEPDVTSQPPLTPRRD